MLKNTLKAAFYNHIKEIKVEKYNSLKNWLKKIKGSSTGHLPNQVKIKKETKKKESINKYIKLVLFFWQKKGRK